MSPTRGIAALSVVALALLGGGARVAAAQAAGATAIPAIPHPVAGHAACLDCHGHGANAHVVAVPANHQFTDAMCAACHKSGGVQPPRALHDLDTAHAQCAACHVANGPAPRAAVPPASHARYDDATCAMCHRGTAPPGAPHLLDAAHTRCLVCHAPGTPVRGITRLPASHLAFDVSSCGSCHTGIEPPRAGHLMDAAHSGCRACHKADSPVAGAKVPPASHAAYDPASCQTCHWGGGGAAPPG